MYIDIAMSGSLATVDVNQFRNVLAGLILKSIVNMSLYAKDLPGLLLSN
jgi:hypothetical protein